MVVHPGDIMIGDADGLVAIPQADAETVLAGARAQKQKEAASLAAIAAGKLDRAWVDEALKARGLKL